MRTPELGVCGLGWTCSGAAFAEGVADYLGMRWMEELEGEYRMITVTRR